MKSIVIIPTYNEIENISSIISAVLAKKDDFQIDISNNLVIDTEFETTNIELWDSFANDIEFRKNLITNGYKVADEFKEKIQRTS